MAIDHYTQLDYAQRIEIMDKIAELMFAVAAAKVDSPNQVEFWGQMATCIHPSFKEELFKTLSAPDLEYDEREVVLTKITDLPLTITTIHDLTPFSLAGIRSLVRKVVLGFPQRILTSWSTNRGEFKRQLIECGCELIEP